HRITPQPGVARIKIEIGCFGEYEVLARRQGDREKVVPELEAPLIGDDLEPRINDYGDLGAVLKPEHAGIVPGVHASRTDEDRLRVGIEGRRRLRRIPVPVLVAQVAYIYYHL